MSSFRELRRSSTVAQDVFPQASIFGKTPKVALRFTFAYSKPEKLGNLESHESPRSCGGQTLVAVDELAIRIINVERDQTRVEHE